MKTEIDILGNATLMVSFLLFPLMAAAVLGLKRGGPRDVLFACVNVFGAFLFCFFAHLRFEGHLTLGDVATRTKQLGPGFLAYVVGVALNFWFLQYATKTKPAWKTWALWAPLSLILLAKFVPPLGGLFLPGRIVDHLTRFTLWFVGVSYLSFRLCILAREVNNEVAPMPGLSRYLSFAFFVPTLSMGPISPYGKFAASLEGPADRARMPVERCIERIIVGLTKFLFLATILGNLSYSGLLLDGHPHAKIDLLVAIPAFALYLFCNFSGYCDVVIGVSGLLGIEIIENFDRPFSSRNFQEFWSRWHISLSLWFRDMMFTPMVKTLTRKYGAKNSSHIIAFTIVSVFVVLGIWHGANLHFALFGLSQGLGVAAVHYSTIYWKKRLGPKGFVAYRENKLYRLLGQIATFIYFAVTLFLFANDFAQIRAIGKALNAPAANIQSELVLPSGAPGDGTTRSMRG